MNKKNRQPLEKWFKHEYTPMIVVGVAILGVMAMVYLFFSHQQETEALREEENDTAVYSESIEIRSSGPGGKGRVKMNYYVRSEKAFEESMASKEHVIRDLTIETLLSWEEESLHSREGMESFKGELEGLIYEKTGIPVEGIYFREFILN